MMDTIRMTMSQALLRFLSKQYVERDGRQLPFFAGVFGIFGHGNVTGIGQALEQNEDLPFHLPRNEQAMVHTAAAFARMKNRLQTFACTSSIGPGATNMLTGAACATVDRLPVLLLPGDIFATRKPHPVLQQLEYAGSQDVSVNDAFRPVSKYWDRINRPEQILYSLPTAVRILTDQAETGAVTIAMPEDVQTEGYDYPTSFFEKRVHRISRPVPADAEITCAIERIRNSHRPLIVTGGGTIYSEASDALDRLARTCGIPISETQAGKGALSWDHPWVVGPVGSNGGMAANRLAASADLVIAIGTRLQDFTTASMTAFQDPNVQFVGINVAASDAFKLGALPLVGDARATIDVLTVGLGESGYYTNSEFQQSVHALKQEWDAEVDRVRVQTEAGGALSEANLIGIVNEFSQPRDVLVCAAGGLPGELLKLWRCRDPKGYHLEYGYSTMGYEIAGGLGVKMADPSREVFVMVGDGSYLMMHSEITTSLQEGYKLVIVVSDNSGYQCIRGLQESSGTPAFGNEFRNRSRNSGRLDGEYIKVDFCRNAKSLGAKGYFADTPDSLREALHCARAEDRTTVIHVPVDVDAQVPGYESWWDVPVAEVSTQGTVQSALAAYRKAKRKQRYHH
jgi:3D-(3,5/4)-trihydroxycyclohexane-1,2-dione acylhydrolase (decyclizing)